MKFHPLKSYVLNPVTLDMDAGTFTATIMAEVTNMENQAVVDAIIRLAKERGVTNLYLLDERFVLDALQEKMEREKGIAEDAVPVVHARWIGNNVCSACHGCIRGYAVQMGYKFCPNCGAKMDGGCSDG